MSKTNGRGPKIETVDASQDEVLSSGVKVTILPFSARLHDSIQSKAQEKFPSPVPPKKIIKVVDGTEEVEDTKNPEYLQQKQQIETQRNNWSGQKIGENVIDSCLLVDVQPYQRVIKKLYDSLEEVVPDSEDEVREFFLLNYAIRGRADYERVTSVSLSLMAVGDKEIQQRMESFRDEMARAVNSESQTPSTAETIRMDLE